MNCHVMTTQYLTWQHSSHARVATCNDCHVPHDNLVHKFAFKAQDGSWHATVFTMRWEPQVIRLSERAKPVVQANCRRCHEPRGRRGGGCRPTAPTPIATAGTAIARRRTARFAAFRPPRRSSSRDCPTFPNSTKNPPLAADRHGLQERSPIRADNFEASPHHDDVHSDPHRESFAILRSTSPATATGLARLAAPVAAAGGDVRPGNPGRLDLASPRGSGADGLPCGRSTTWKWMPPAGARITRASTTATSEWTTVRRPRQTKYGGAAKRDYLEEGPATVILFAGSTFDKEYHQARGHTHTIDDVTGTLRVKIEDPKTHELVLNPEKPATCWTCKSPDVPRLMKKLGGAERSSTPRSSSISRARSRTPSAATTATRRTP